MNYYYILLDVFSFLVPFAFSFEKKMIHFVQFWKPFFTAIILVGLFFIAWDIYFTYQNVWGFTNQYLLGIRIFKLPLEEWLFFLLIPYSSIFIHYSLLYFFPKSKLSRFFTQILSIIFYLISILVTIFNIDKIYTFYSFGLFSLLMLLQVIFQFKYARRFYLSFIIIYIPFFFVNNALTGAYSENPVVYYNSSEILGYRVGTMPLEDSFYCFSLLYGIVLVFEFLKKKWNTN
jgi:lycopene cyclase domain-containing protein